MTGSKTRVVAAEALGTGLLLFVIVGSGIVAERSTNDPGVHLVLHAVAVGAGLAVLIAMLAGVSGAHFNPAVTLAFWRRQNIDTPTAISYLTGQVVGAIVGVGLANLTYSPPVFALSATSRTSAGAVAGELVGTLILVLLILALADQDLITWVPVGVGGWVVAMVLATPSGGFLNPAVTVARSLTDTYAGIAPSSVPGFVLAQIVAAGGAVMLAEYLMTTPRLKGT